MGKYDQLSIKELKLKARLYGMPGLIRASKTDIITFLEKNDSTPTVSIRGIKRVSAPKAKAATKPKAKAATKGCAA